MIHDLSNAGSASGAAGGSRELTTDVLVIGAGIAGLLIATRLARVGCKVIVAESGSRSQTDDHHPLNRVEQLGALYDGAENGRFRCLGGTSTRWGGAMLPFQAGDLRQSLYGAALAWPIPLEALTAYQSEIEALFNLGTDAYDHPEIMREPGTEAAFISRLAKWPPFRNRNVATLLAPQIDSPTGPEVWLNATATRLLVDEAGRGRAAELHSANGGTLRINANEIVIAAGAIESTRLLLLMDRDHRGRLFAPHDQLGRYFFDHLSLTTARFVDFDRKALNRLVGWRFDGARMRSLRFEPSEQLRAQQGLAPGFVHVKFFSEQPGGFLALRDVFRKLQKRESPSVRDLGAMALAMPWLARAAWWRFIEHRLLFPDSGDLEIHAVVEQAPFADSRITLSAHQIDTFGAPLAAIDWRVRDVDADMLRSMTRHFAAAWSRSSLAPLGRIELNIPDNLTRALAAGGGIYHPGGTVRMGSSAHTGVVDGELRTFAVPNLSVVSTAIFPTGGGANPTMMLMMAALRVADRIARRR